jgi:hypothetical protein
VGKAHYYDLDARAPIAAGPLFIHQVGRRRILGGARRDRATAAQELKLADLANRTGDRCAPILELIGGPCDEIAPLAGGDCETD